MPTATKKPKASGNNAAQAPHGAKPGYKYTKLGWIPEEWEVCRLGDAFEFRNGYNADSADYGHGVPFVNVLDVITHTELTEDLIKGKVNIGNQAHELNSVRHGDVLFNRTSETPEEVGLASTYSGNAVVTFGGFVIRGRQTSDAFDPKYLRYGLRVPVIRKQIIAMGNGAVRSNIGQGDLSEVLAPKPSLPEQRRIAEVLGAWDRAMATVQQLLAAQQERKRGLMQELLTGRRRFKGFGGKWKSHRLGDMFERVTRKNTVGEEHVLTISAQHGLIDQREIFNKSVAGANLAGYYLLRNGEFAYNKSSSNGYPVGAIKRLDRYDQGVLSTLYICFALKPGKANSDFMAAYFDGGMLDEGIGAIAQEGARNHGLLNVSTTDFFELDVHTPDEAEQAAIAKAIGALNKETEAIQNYLDQLTTQKRGLMQQLLTGAVRVNE